MFFKFILERRGRERERNFDVRRTSTGCLPHTRRPGSNSQPRCVPCLSAQPFGVRGDPPTEPTLQQGPAERLIVVPRPTPLPAFPSWGMTSPPFSQLFAQVSIFRFIPGSPFLFSHSHPRWSSNPIGRTFWKHLNWPLHTTCSSAAHPNIVVSLLVHCRCLLTALGASALAFHSLFFIIQSNLFKRKYAASFQRIQRKFKPYAIACKVLHGQSLAAFQPYYHHHHHHHCYHFSCSRCTSVILASLSILYYIVTIYLSVLGLADHCWEYFSSRFSYNSLPH